VIARGILLFALALPALAQDPEWVARWEASQRERPAAANLSPRSRIAPPGEPGEPLIVHGRVFQADGTTPVADAIVFAYQTDAKGLYNAPGAKGWRLKGWAISARDGSFEFTTIRPAPYPSNTLPAHIHFGVEGGGVPRQWTPELRFEDDALLSGAMREAAHKEGKFGDVRPVRREGKIQHVEFNIHAKTSADF